MWSNWPECKTEIHDLGNRRLLSLALFYFLTFLITTPAICMSSLVTKKVLAFLFDDLVQLVCCLYFMRKCIHISPI